MQLALTVAVTWNEPVAVAAEAEPAISTPARARASEAVRIENSPSAREMCSTRTASAGRKLVTSGIRRNRNHGAITFPSQKCDVRHKNETFPGLNRSDTCALQCPGQVTLRVRSFW